MTTKTEALKLALEAYELEQSTENHGALMCAIKEALAQPEQEPVAHMNQHGVIHEAGYPWGPTNRLEPLYNTPPQRTWVGLTDDEFEDIELGCRSTPFGKIEAMQMVEAKLKEKNA